MKKIILPILMLMILGCTHQKTKDDKQESAALQYPETRKGNVVDDYFGTKVADPYRWLEDDNSEETANWVIAQNKVTHDYLKKIPFRATLKKRLTKLWNYARMSTPEKNGELYCYLKNDGLQNQGVLYCRKGLEGEEKVLLDPNKLSEDGTVALSGWRISEDGKYLAYKIARSGSDWNEIYVKNIETNEMLADHVKWVKFSGIAWYKDGFFYSCYDSPAQGQELSKKNEFHKIKYHKLKTDPKDDKVFYENKDFPLRNYHAGVSEDEKYVFVFETESTSGSSFWVKDMTKKDAKFVHIAKGFDYEYNLIDEIDNQLYVVTTNGAPKYRLVKIDLKNPQEDKWETIIPEKENVMGSVSIANKKIVVTYMVDAKSKVEVYKLDGTFDYEMQLPGLGSVGGFSCKKDEKIAFYSFTSFTTPSTVYKYDFDSKKSEVFFKPKVDFNPEDFEVKQVFFTSKDGTKIPMFIFHKKGIQLDGNNPTILYGYGGFSISLTPSFRARRIAWIEAGGVFASVNLRGGGEYGEAWHKAGTKLQKQNVFDDCIAAAEYLISQKYTSPEKLGLKGGSNGGLLVGAVINQRPDLFKVAIPEVGVMDMLRYHKFTIGWAWATDYGTSEDSVQFHNLIKYSPIHTIKENVEYPAIMVITADHDDRVVPAHSFKYIAGLQDKYKGKNPVIIRIDTKAGHGAGMPTSKQIEEYEDIWSFAFYNMGVNPF